MKIGIIGGGSLGLLYSYYLSQTHDVSLYVRRDKQMQALHLKGLTLTNQGNRKVKVYDEIKELNHDLIIFALKQIDLVQFLEKQHKLFHQQTLLFIQNGMGHIEHLHYFENPIILGSVEHGAARLNDHTVEQNGVGKTRLALYQGRGINKVIEELNSKEFQFAYESNWRSMLSNKLLVNAVINPLTALFEVKNGQLLKDKYLRSMTSLVFDEVCDILDLPKKESEKMLIAIIQSTEKNTSSMLADIKRKDKTEIEAILGYLIKESKNGSPLLSILYDSVKYKENRSVRNV